MTYNSGSSQLLSAILRDCAGQAVAEFAEDQLFQPLGIQSYHWESDPQGIHTGGFGLHLKPEDMLKFGLLYLQEGRWKDQQILFPDTIQQSTRPYVEANHPQKDSTAGIGGYPNSMQVQSNSRTRSLIILHSALKGSISL